MKIKNLFVNDIEPMTSGSKTSVLTTCPPLHGRMVLFKPLRCLVPIEEINVGSFRCFNINQTQQSKLPISLCHKFNCNKSLKGYLRLLFVLGFKLSSFKYYCTSTDLLELRLLTAGQHCSQAGQAARRRLLPHPALAVRRRVHRALHRRNRD